MSRYDALMRRIDHGERILIDGATGTEVERRGVPELDHAWSAGAAISHPEILREVHQDYIRVGAEIIISNTFATTRHALRDAGRESDFDALNRRGVELVVEARDRMEAPHVLVAGGISYWSWTDRHPTLLDLRNDVTRQAAVMREAGADLLMLEMMVDVDRMIVTVDAAQSVGLPVWPGLTCEPGAAGAMCLRNGEPLSRALSALKGRDVPVLTIMHSHVDHIDGALDVVQARWRGPIGVYAHAGGHDGEAWVEEKLCPPDRYAVMCARWLDWGVQVIGGCCGMGVEHIAALKPLV